MYKFSLYLFLLIAVLCFQNGYATLFEEQEFHKEQDINPMWSSSNLNLYESAALFKRRRPTINFTQIVCKAVTNLQNYMKNGNTTLGIQVIEPYLFNDTVYNISTSREIITLNGQINGTIVGLTDFTIQSCVTDLAAFWANVTLVFNKITASGFYKTSGLIADIVPVEGEGPYLITWTNVTASFQPQTNGNSTNILLKQLKVSYTVDSSQMNVDGLMGQLSDTMKRFVQDAQDGILRRTLSWVEATLEQCAINFATNEVFKNVKTDKDFLVYLQQF